MTYQLKRIHPDGIAAALAKADKYRELNQPAEAASICRDVLAIDAENQLALRTLGLALTDQFEPSSGARFAEVQEVFARLKDPYERAFYGGLACERQAKAQLEAHLPVHAVRPLFEQALSRYAEAEAIRPAGNDDPVLRWNSCVRTLQGIARSAKSEGEPALDIEGDFVPHQGRK
jgi:predicted component of type VI protein secretion system